MLYCTTCRQVANAGDAICGRCQNGYVSRLACGKCADVVPVGRSFCAKCDVVQEVSIESSQLAPRRVVPPPLNLPSLDLILPPNLPPDLSPARLTIPETYEAGRFGAKAVVTMNGKDAEIMTKMNQVALLLHALAAEMNEFQGVSDSTRRLIKNCRMLSVEIQEEVEVRRGPR